jgi:hypothetical protein
LNVRADTQHTISSAYSQIGVIDRPLTCIEQEVVAPGDGVWLSVLPVHEWQMRMQILEE